ncbi:MAG: hypothetical protein ACI4QI_00510 [Candidatus Coproplasma sp.]
MDFEDLRLIDLLDKVQKKAEEISATRNVSQFKELGTSIQAVYDYFIVCGKSYDAQQPMLKNLFSAFNYGAVIINDAIKTRQLDKEANTLLDECLQIIVACCVNIKNSIGH